MATRTDDDAREADIRDEPAPPPPPDSAKTAEQVTVEREPRRSRPVLDTIRFLVAGALIAVLAMFAAANDQTTEVDYIVATEAVPLVAPLAGAMAGGMLLALLLRRRG